MLMKTKHSVHIIVFWVVTIFLHEPWLNTKDYINLMLTWIERVVAGNSTLTHATQARETCLCCEKISSITSTAVEQHTKKRLCITKDWLNERKMSSFTDLNKETIGKACKRFPWRLEMVVNANSDFKE